MTGPLFSVGSTVRVTPETLDVLLRDTSTPNHDARTYRLGFVNEVAESTNVLMTGTVVLYGVTWYSGDRRPGVRHIFRESELMTARLPNAKRHARPATYHPATGERTPHTVYMDVSEDGTVYDEPASFYTGGEQRGWDQ